MRIDHPTGAEIPGLRLLWKEAFDDTDAFLDGFFASGFAPERCLCADDGGTVAAALYWFRCSCGDRKIAYIYALATKESHRGRGIARALLEKTATVLKAQGFSGMLLVPGGQELFAMYRKLGFADTLYADAFVAEAGGEPVPVRQVEAEAYARLRRAALPSGGVVQEGENLSFLSTFAGLYAGDGWLLAGSLEEDIFSGMEFLGDRSAVPGILKGLGAKRGTFRTPGEGRPFAQYRSLDGTPAPRYFGLAFD